MRRTIVRNAVVALALTAGLGLAWGWSRFSSAPLARAEAAYRRGDWRAAAALARERLKAVPTDDAAQQLLARVSARLGHDEAALARFARVDPDRLTAEDETLRGIALFHAGRREEAVRALEHALELDPGRGEALEPLVQLRGSERRLEEASQLAERLARQPGWEAAGLRLLGVLRVDLNDPAGAAEALSRAERLDPNGIADPATADRFRRLLARSLLQLGKPAEARAALGRIDPSRRDAESAWLLSRAWLQEGNRPEVLAALARSGTYREDHPLLPEPSPYVGAAQCAPCHSEIHRAQLASRHTRSCLSGDDLLSLPLPDGPLPDPDDRAVTHTIRREGDHLQADTAVDGEVARVLVEYAFGTPDRYATLVGHDEHGVARALRLSYYRNQQGSGWDRTAGDHGTGPGVEKVLGQRVDVREGVIRCLYCHATNPTPADRPAGPEAADRGIGCERCHGPGGNHLAAQELKLADRAIVNPRRADPATLTRGCAECHILGDTDAATSRDDPVWVRSQGATLTWSRCYTESGTLSCLTCHDAHHNAAETPTSAYEAKCLGCHRGPAEATAGDPGPSACPVDPRSGCIACHMPQVRDALPHTSLTDHYIRIRKD